MPMHPVTAVTLLCLLLATSTAHRASAIEDADSPQEGTIKKKEFIISNRVSRQVQEEGEEEEEEDEDDESLSPRVSNLFKYESSRWEQRNLKGSALLNTSAFEEALTEASELLCGLGITATIFDGEANQVYQNTVGSNYVEPTGYLSEFSEPIDGWTGDTTMTLYSNSKILGVATYLASVVDTGLGYLDEPIYLTFPEYLTEDDVAGKVTPRMLMSHTSGFVKYARGDEDDPYYGCIYDERTTLLDCLAQYFFRDDKVATEPGSLASYANEPFDIIAAIVTRKTGFVNYGEAFRRYITVPLGMESTTVDCPIVQSTSEKPHIAWGVCSTAHDMAKMVQLLANNGSTLDGEQILSKYSVQQMFSRGTGVAANGDGTILALNMFPVTRCYDVLTSRTTVPISISGYGLGTMFWPGTKGEWFAHAATTGGIWIVAPDRFSAYIGWMVDTSSPKYSFAYYFIASALDRLEQSSTFLVSPTNTAEENWEELETCGGDLFIDWLSRIGSDSVLDALGFASCDSSTSRSATDEETKVMMDSMEVINKFL